MFDDRPYARLESRVQTSKGYSQRLQPLADDLTGDPVMLSEEVDMRVLFSFAGGSGHADPLVPLADAATAAGHTVAFAGRRSGAVLAQAHGFAVFAMSEDTREQVGEIRPLLGLDMQREFDVLRRFYAGSEARERAAGILRLIADWSPDLIVCDEVDFGGMIAAERAGLPHVTCLVIASGSFIRPEVVVDPLDSLRSEHGLPRDPEMAMSSRHLVVSPFPPSFRDPAHPLPANAISIREETIGDRDLEAEPRWLPRLAERTTVYVTLGTVFNTESGDLFKRILAALRELPIEVVVTTGRDLDPHEFGTQPKHVHIERYIPQSTLLPFCDLVLDHGGSGSVIGALAHGLPQVVVPMGADQSLNADRCMQLGVGIALDAVRATAVDLREAVTGVLDAPAYRTAAEAIRDEIALLPGPEATVPLFERLVAEKPMSPPP